MPGPPVPATDRRVPPPPRAVPPAGPSSLAVDCSCIRIRSSRARRRSSPARISPRNLYPCVVQLVAQLAQVAAATRSERRAARCEPHPGPSASPCAGRAACPVSGPPTRRRGSGYRSVQCSPALLAAYSGISGVAAPPFNGARSARAFKPGQILRSGAGGFAPEPGPSRRGTAGRSDARPTRRRAAGYRTICAETSAECLRSFAKSYLYFANVVL